MAKLQFSLDGNSLGEFELNKERITIGRRPANDIHIDNLAVSGEHAVITTIGNDSFLEDMNSTNGTLVNNKPIKKHVLHHNDIIEFGKYQLVYVNQTQANMPPNHGGFENTVVLRPSKLNIAQPEAAKVVDENLVEEAPKVPPVTLPVAESALQSQAKVPEENIEKTARLKMLNGGNSGREMFLNKALTTLGKPGTQVAVITKRVNGYFITHVEGEHLPVINGLKIGPQAHALSDHDTIDIAGLKMEFFLA
jgi:pSer/pThr/pTyr-binding forkhead associated (FHA) protein